jgi:spermidine synthase
MVLVGQVEPLRINVDEIEERLNRPEYAQVKQSLAEIGINSAVELFANYAGRGSDLRSWLQDAQINRDRNLRLQYLAGMGLNLYESDVIYADMITHARYPEDIFTGSEATLAELRDATMRMLGR